MRSWLILTALLAISTWLAQAAACAEICYTTVLTGFGPGGTPGCTCSGSQQGARTGEGDCNCGQCYQKTQGVVYGFAINADGTCTYGTDCGTCDYSTGSASSSTSTTSKPVTSTPSPVPTSTPTPTPSITPSSVPSSSAADSSSSTSSTTDSTSTSNSESTGSNNSNSRDNVGNSTGSQANNEARDKSLSTWQIILAICCIVLIFLVAVVSVCACYCKARSRLNEHEDDQASYYNPHLPFQPWAANNARTEVPVATKSVNIV